MRRRLTGFALKVLALALLVTVVVVLTWMRWGHPVRREWLWAAAAMVLTGGFVPAMFLGFRVHHPLLRIVTLVCAVAVGYLSFGLVAAVASWIVVAVAAATGHREAIRPAVEGLYGVAVVVATYGLVNAVVPRTTRVTVRLRGLPAAWRGRTVALVSDVHLGNVRNEAFVRHLVWRLNRLRPDAVFISGDMFDGTRLDADRAAAGWAALKPPRGTYFVTGNHDERGQRARHAAALERAGIRVLNNERVVVDGLQVVGVHDDETHAPEVYRELLDRAGIVPEAASVLLAHQPVNLAVPEAAGVALQLSGHTHGGQFWPWSLIARRVHGRYVYGLNDYGRMQIYTSSGAGTWGPPFRVGTRSEIVALRLEPAAAEPGEAGAARTG